jgi:hypothetical protein
MQRIVRRWAWPVVVALLAAPALPAAPPKRGDANADKGAPLGSAVGALVGAAVEKSPKTQAAGAAAVREKVLQELTAILNETDSADTFLVTTMVLEKMGPDARAAVPALVRNAERLGLLKGLFRADGRGKKAEAAEVVMKAIETILQKKQRYGYPPAACYPPDPLLRGGSYSPPCATPPTSPPCPPPPVGGPTPTSLYSPT